MTHFNRIKHATNVEIDAALGKMRVNDIQKMNTGPLGMDWQDTTAIPQYSSLINTPAKIYYNPSIAWPWHARHAWFHTHLNRPDAAVTEAIANKQITPPWAWHSNLKECLQPAVWGVVSLFRDSRKKSDTLLNTIVAQAMEGATDSQERIDRISELLGGSLKHAIDLVGNLGGSGWNAIPSWGNVLVDMLEVVIQPQTLGEGAKQLQHRWQEAIAHVATSQEEQAAMMAAVHQKAMLAWNACLLPLKEILPLKEKQTSPMKPKQQRVGIEGFNMDTIERLTNMAADVERLHPTSPGVQQSIETLVIQTLEQEAKRRKTLKPDERILVSRNIHLLNLLSRVLCDQPLQPTFAKAATPHVNMIEKGYSSELDRLRAYLHRQNFLDISNTITRPANKRSLRF